MSDVDTSAAAVLTASRALLAVVARSIAPELDRVTVPQFRVLVVLSTAGQPVRNRDLAEADLKRYRELREQNFISSAELDRREATWKAANAQVEQARAQLATQGNQSAYATLRSDERGARSTITPLGWRDIGATIWPCKRFFGSSWDKQPSAVRATASSSRRRTDGSANLPSSRTASIRITGWITRS